MFLTFKGKLHPKFKLLLWSLIHKWKEPHGSQQGSQLGSHVIHQTWCLYTDRVLSSDCLKDAAVQLASTSTQHSNKPFSLDLTPECDAAVRVCTLLVAAVQRRPCRIISNATAHNRNDSDDFKGMREECCVLCCRWWHAHPSTKAASRNRKFIDHNAMWREMTVLKWAILPRDWLCDIYIVIFFFISSFPLVVASVLARIHLQRRYLNWFSWLNKVLSIILIIIILIIIMKRDRHMVIIWCKHPIKLNICSVIELQTPKKWNNNYINKNKNFFNRIFFCLIFFSFFCFIFSFQ